MSNDLVERASQYISKNHTSDTDVRRSKAREWNLAHERWPNKILKWDSASKTYKPTSSTQSESSIDASELEVLQEISIRTIGLGASMMKHSQFAKNIKQQAAKMKNLASTLSQTDSDDVRWNVLKVHFVCIFTREP